jgi:hypothetical protein
LDVERMRIMGAPDVDVERRRIMGGSLTWMMKG